MTATVTAPWDEATVHALNACLHGTGFHGFTCAEHTSTLLGEAREAIYESDHGDELIVIKRLIDDATQEAP